MLRLFREALARPGASPSNNIRSAIRAHNAVILDAEYQLAFGHSLPEMRRARDNLRIAVPNCPLVEALEEKIARTQGDGAPAFRPMGSDSLISPHIKNPPG